jgi:hypothetical protein
MAMLRGLKECAKLKGVRFVHVRSFGQEPNWFPQPVPSRISEACRRAFVSAFAKVRKEFDLLFGHNPVASLTAEESHHFLPERTRSRVWIAEISR